MVLITSLKKKTVRNTNIVTLHNMVKPDVRKFYIEGVGTNFKLLGLGMGIGVSKRVRNSYHYLASNYKPGDSICLFGFSRGAYSCRILSNFVYVVGLPDFSNINSEPIKRRIIRRLYLKYRGEKSLEGRKYQVTKFINKWNERHLNYPIVMQPDSVKIELMGLYDTVEALALPDYTEDDFAFPTRYHLNQVDNVKKVFHALSLDDNRAQIFTPILLTSDDVKHNSNDKNISKIVEEVWFSGCHLDVGGGHKKNPLIHNISLNWMLSVTKPYNLFESGSDIVEYPTLEVNNMQKNLFWVALYKKQNRNIPRYYTANQSIYPKLKVHESVIERLKQGMQPDFKIFKKDTLDWFDKLPFKNCFVKEDNKRHFQEPCDCIEVVRTKD